MRVNIEWNKTMTYKLLFGVVLLLLIFISVRLLRVQKNLNGLEDVYQKKLQTEINERREAIEELQAVIKRSKEVISDLKVKQTQYEHSLDSLSALKQRTRTIYKEKIVRVNNFSGVEVENYWKERLSNGVEEFLPKE